MRMMPIASGSSGNCIYVGSDNTHILIDAGVSRKKICEGLNKLDLSMKDISAILVTHEHIDHIKGLGVISRKDNIPVYTTKGTVKGICDTSSIGEVPNELFNEITPDNDFKLNDICIHSFNVSHDANEPVAYTVTDGEKKACVLTDLGYFDDYIVDNIKNPDVLMVEANYDLNLLQVGSYPYYLKQRIIGKKGHLSNENSGQLINDVLHNNLKKIILGHLSKENTYDKLAYETVRLEIDMSHNEYKSSDFNIEVAKRSEPSDIIQF